MKSCLFFLFLFGFLIPKIHSQNAVVGASGDATRSGGNVSYSTEYTENGVDQLPTMTVEQKEIEFTDIFIEDGSAPNPNEPSKIPLIDFSFSSFGINIGLQYQF